MDVIRANCLLHDLVALEDRIVLDVRADKKACYHESEVFSVEPNKSPRHSRCWQTRVRTHVVFQEKLVVPIVKQFSSVLFENILLNPRPLPNVEVFVDIKTCLFFT